MASKAKQAATDMTVGKPAPILLKFVLPLFTGNIFQQLYNMVDTVIVGRFVGADALAAVGSTGTIMFLLIGLAMGLATGFAVLTSQSFGAKDEVRVRQSVANAILLSLICTGLLTAVFSLCMKGLLRVMNTPDDIFGYAYSYISVICWGLAAMVFYNLASALLRAVGNSRVPLYFLIMSACLNVVLDLVFIINFGWGVAGAAWATVISQGVSAAACFLYIWKKVRILRPVKGDWKLRHDMSAAQFRVGIPMCLQYAITASGTMIMQAAVNMFGSTAIAGYTAATKLGNLLTQGMPAMGQTMAAYSGQNYGSGQYDRIKKGVRAALVIEVIYALAAACIGVLLLRPAMGLFFSGDADINEMMPWARTYAYLSYCFYIPLSIIFNFRNTMQGCGYGLLPMLGGVVEFTARLVTAVISMNIGSYALACACDPAAWTAAAVFTGIAYLWVMKDIERKRVRENDKKPAGI